MKDRRPKKNFYHRRTKAFITMAIFEAMDKLLWKAAKLGEGNYIVSFEVHVKEKGRVIDRPVLHRKVEGKENFLFKLE